jgi:hypothetical protein
MISYVPVRKLRRVAIASIVSLFRSLISYRNAERLLEILKVRRRIIDCDRAGTELASSISDEGK